VAMAMAAVSGAAAMEAVVGSEAEEDWEVAD
jgi:hypothetical protein